MRGLGLGAGDFPSFSEGLSLRHSAIAFTTSAMTDFPSFSEGLSLRLLTGAAGVWSVRHFPSFSEGLSLRQRRRSHMRNSC